jgi:Flp pilus assembly protein TadD
MHDSKNDCTNCHMPAAATEVPHVAFTHHHIGVRPLKKKDARPNSDRSLTPLSDLAVLAPTDQARTAALASAQLYGRLSRAQAATETGIQLGRETAELLGKIPAESIDALVEVVRAELALSRGDSTGAAEAAQSALALAGNGTDSAVRALAVLAKIRFLQNSFEEARHLFRRLTELRRDASDWHYLGLCENNCGSVDASVRALQRSREIDPASPGPCEALAVIQHVRKEFGAEKELRDEIARLGRWNMRRGKLRSQSQ